MFGTTPQAAGPSAQAGPDLTEVVTTQLGFSAVKGEVKLRLLPSRWSQKPSPTASLLSVANKKAVLAAAAPEGIIIASTKAVREAFNGNAENNVVTGFTPQLSMQTPRVSQVTFTTDEQFLVIAAEQGGGLAVYVVDDFSKNKKEPAFQISTEGINIRTLAPNPSQENAYGVAVVLEDGKLMLADLNDKKFVTASQGPVLSEGVSCVSWSNKGKQLVAGLGDGAVKQLAPDGTLKAQIPLPPQIQQSAHGVHYVSSITWLANDEFVIAYTPAQFDQDQTPESKWFWVLRKPQTQEFQFRAFPEPGLSPPFGFARNPPHHFVTRLSKFAPNLDDSLIVASSPSCDITIAAKASQPLSPDVPADAVRNQFTLASMQDDSRRAQMPTDENMDDTVPIGTAFDLSTTEPVKRPIPGDDVDESATPLPLFLVLNHEGILSAWWYVYSDSVRQKTSYPGLAINAGQQAVASATPTSAIASAAHSSAFGASKPAFGTPSGSAFGQPGGLGSSSSPWSAAAGSKPAFGQPAFGQPGGAAFGQPGGATFGKPGGAAFGTPGGAAFGTPGGLGATKSPWSTAAATQPSADKPSPFAGGSTASPWASAGLGNKAAASPFATANTSAASPFGTAAGQKSSLFGGSTPAPPLTSGQSFGSTITIGSSLPTAGSFGAPSTDKSPFATPSLSNDTSAKVATDDDMMDDADAPAKPQAKTEEPSKTTSNLFGLSNGGFKLGENKNETPAADNEPKQSVSSFFGFGFGSALGDAAKEETKAEVTKEETEAEVTKEETEAEVTKEVTKTETSKVGEAPVKADADDAPLPPDPFTNRKLYDEAKKLELPPGVGGPAKSADSKEPELKPVETSQAVEPKPAEPSQPVGASQTAEVPTEALPESPKEASKELPESPAGSSPVDLGASGSSHLSSAPSSEGDKEKKETASKKPSNSPSRIPKPTSPLRDGPGWSFPKASTGRLPPPKSPQSRSPTRLGAKSPEPQKTPAAAKSIFSSDTPSFTPPTTFKPGPPKALFGSTAPKPSIPPPESPTPQSSATNPPFMFPKPDAEAVEAPKPQVPRSRGPSPQRPGSNATFPRAASPSRPTVIVPRSLSSLTKDEPKVPSQPHQPLQQKKVDLAVEDLEDDEEEEEEDEDEPKSPTKQEVVFRDDTTDLQVARELESSIEKIRDMPPFIAEQSYHHYLKMPPGIPSQAERVYRDSASMVDVLGLNSRAVRGFVAYHEEVKDAGRDWRSDLVPDKINEWTLGEIEDLAVCERELESHLAAERLSEPKERIAKLTQVLREVGKLRARHADTHRLLALHNGEGADADRAARAGLTAEQKTTLHDLRKSYAGVQTQIREVEESVSLLSAKLASAESTNGPATAVPTVEAIIKTVQKMTRMAEIRRNEIDVLERKMRSLGFVRRAVEDDDLGLSRMSLHSRASPASSRTNRASPASNRSSRFNTPRAQRTAQFSTPKSSGTFKLEYSDSESEGEGGSAQRHSLRAPRSPSAGAAADGPAFLDIVDEARIAEWKDKRERREKVLRLLREKVKARFLQDAGAPS